MYIGDMPFLVTLSNHIMFGTTEFLANREKETLVNVDDNPYDIDVNMIENEDTEVLDENNSHDTDDDVQTEKNAGVDTQEYDECEKEEHENDEAMIPTSNVPPSDGEAP